VVTDIGTPFFARAVRGISDSARSAGYEVLLSNTDGDPSAEERALRVLEEKRADGVIVAPSDPAAVDAARRLLEGGTPVVALDRRLSGLRGADSVLLDNRKAAREAVAYLIALGHRRIAVLSEGSLERALAATETRDVVRERPSVARVAGYLCALREAGLEVDPDLVLHSAYDRIEAVQVVGDFLSRGDRASALFCTDALLSTGAFTAVRESGLACPEELSFIAFDDQEWTQLVRPRLTVVSQPAYEIGAAAVGLLLRRIRNLVEGGGEVPQGGSAPRWSRSVHEQLRSKLVIRESVQAWEGDSIVAALQPAPTAARPERVPSQRSPGSTKG
jgi:LacI family transcriptional regulator